MLNVELDELEQQKITSVCTSVNQEYEAEAAVGTVSTKNRELKTGIKMWHQHHESMDPIFIVLKVPAGGGGVKVWGM